MKIGELMGLEKNTSDNVVRTLLSNISRTALFVGVVCPIILFYLWVAKKLEIPLLNPTTITTKEKIITNGSIYILESEPVNILDIEITTDIITLDNLSFTDKEREKISKLHDKFPNTTELYSLLKSNFTPKLGWIQKNYPYTSDSFRRFEEAMKEPVLHKSLFSEERKKILLSESYWSLNRHESKIIIFPPSIQYSVSVLKLTGITSNAKLIMDMTNDPLKQALRRVSGQQTKIIEETDGIAYACLYNGESIKFNSKNYSWTLRIKRIVNPGLWRSNDGDLVILDWKAIKISSI